MDKAEVKKLVKLITGIGKLKGVLRTGWVLKGVKNAESVADHTWRVTVIASILAPELNLNQNKIIKMALIHDLGEALIGDIKWETGKRVVGSQEEKHRDEKKAITAMFAHNPNFAEYIELWEEYEAQKTREAKILKQIDKLEMAIQALEYEKEYPHLDFDEFWENAEKYLKGKDLEKYFGALKV